MRGRKREPGTHRLRMRPIFQEFLEIVFSPYISVDGDAMKSRFSTFYCTLAMHMADVQYYSSAVKIVRRWRVRRYLTAGGIRFTLNDRIGKRSLVVAIFVVEMRSWSSVTSFMRFV